MEIRVIHLHQILFNLAFDIECVYSTLLGVTCQNHLLGVDYLKALLHLATFGAPAFVVGHQGDVGVLGDTLVTSTTVNAATVLLVTQVVVAA